MDVGVDEGVGVDHMDPYANAVHFDFVLDSHEHGDDDDFVYYLN